MIGAALALAATVTAQVELRAGEPVPDGTVLTVDARGVLVGKPGRGDGEGLLIGWDRVRRVLGPHAEEAARYSGLSDASWRARSRLERGDWRAAEPLFESLFAEVAWSEGPTAAVVCEGLLRCRVRRGAQASAVVPWLAMVHAQRSDGPAHLHPYWASEAGLGQALDAETGLIPSLPPIWIDGPAVRAFAAESPAITADGPATELMNLYRQGARFEAGLAVDLERPASNDAGVSLVYDVVAARSGDPAMRTDARRSLLARIGSGPPAWIEAWCRVGIGRSLLREEDPMQRRLGVVELLHLPARFGASSPYLTGVALADSAVALADLGDARGAALLRGELLDYHADHPALQWGPIRWWGSAANGGLVRDTQQNGNNDD